MVNLNTTSVPTASTGLPDTTTTSSDTIIATTTNSSTSSTFICIISDLTNVTNTCQKKVINLSGTYLIGQLIQEAADHFNYDPFTFNLIYKASHELINVSELNDCALCLNDIGLNARGKNLFEIHEKDGPPKRQRSNSLDEEAQRRPDAGYKCTNEDWDVDEPNCFSESNRSNIQTYPPQRRNAFASTIYPDSPSSAFLNDSSSSTTHADHSFGVLNSSNMIEYGPVTLDSSTGCFVPYSPSYMMAPTTSSHVDEETGFVGLINQAMTCYLNSLLQTLFMTPEFRNGIYKWKHTLKEEEDCKKNIPFQLQRLFLNLQTSKKKSIQTHDLTKSFGWNNDDAFQQHDVQELCRVMFDALEKTFKGTQQQNLINELYQGKIKDYVKCLECNIESAREDVFLDIPLCIRPFGSDKTFESVEEALDAFVQPEILDDSNKYFCSNCQRQCKAHKGLKFVSFPYIISLQLKRFDFDYKTLSRFKLSNKVTFPEILNVKKYLDHVDSTSTKELCGDYELFSIMIHSGSATGGHYYAYIKCMDTNQWLNFNDERVSKLDRDDIKKAFGTQFSLYSSTTAYMLLYRQIDPSRNEKPIKVEEFDEHLKQLLDREREQQLEAQRLKEYMENVCKVKVLMPSLDKVHDSLCKESVVVESAKLQERTIEIHKDLKLDEAKQQLIKEFHLEEYMRENKLKCRILKYDTYNEVIDECYKDESTTSVLESLGFTKYPYNMCWYLDMVSEEDQFVYYNHNDLNIKVVGLDTSSLETKELCNLRINSESNVLQLRDLIAEKINLVNPDKLRMVLEKSHHLCNYFYLNSSMNETLKSQRFTRVNKVFVEYEDEVDSLRSFEQSKFYYALEAIFNMLQVHVYLPTEEQSECFLKKSKRHALYKQNKAAEKKKHAEQEEQRLKKQQEQNELSVENTLESYDIISSVQSSTNTLSSINISEHDSHHKTDTTLSRDQSHDTQMSFGDTIRSEETINLIEDHFMSALSTNLLPKRDRSGGGGGAGVDMETSFDEGIGSTGSLSATTTVSNGAHNLAKLAPNSSLSPPPSLLQVGALLAAELSPISFGNQVGNDNDDDDVDLDVNIDDNEINNLDDVDFSDLPGLKTSHDDLDVDDVDDEDLRSNDDNYGADDDLLSSSLGNRKSYVKEVKFSSDWDVEVEEEHQTKLNKKTSLETPPPDMDDDTLPSYEEINVKTIMENMSRHHHGKMTESNDQPFVNIKASDSRYIKSNLTVNSELGTRNLEVKMDKRIELAHFKSHLDEYLKLSSLNFRVYRMCPNEMECELTAAENQFLHLQQNSKFMIKLGPPLNYGEYVLSMFQLKKASFTYLCDFMVTHGLDVQSHKELLAGDLKDECNLDIPVEKIRLRRKNGKRPSTIYLNSEVFGTDIFVNSMTELCIQVLEEPEMKTQKSQVSIYLRHWRPDEFELGELVETVIDGNTNELLLNHVSKVTSIDLENLELYKCKQDYPYRVALLNLHRDVAWKESLSSEKLEDGQCFYYRDKTIPLASLSDEKRRDLEKEDTINFRPTVPFMSKKEKGIKIHVNNV